MLAPAMSRASTTTCLVCGHTDFRPHFDILLRCAACGFVTARLDTPVEARRLYEGDYFTGGEYLDYAADEAIFRRTFRRRLERLRRPTSGPAALGQAARPVLGIPTALNRGWRPLPRLLEIGAAYGFFLDLARQHFEVVGFELNPVAARHGRETLGLDIRTTDFLEADEASLGGPVDVTVMWDVIEHIERPDLYLAHANRLSRPGARLHITTGDIGSPLARLRGRRWRMIHPPTHLHYFDRRTIRMFLEARGFRVIRIDSEGVARSLRQVLYSVLALRLNLPALYRQVCRFVPPAWGFTLNTGDIMHVVAERT
jgi:SAM-dependent methyltransferase